MSLREQWYAARVQRQQEVHERKQHVAAFLEATRSYHSQVWLEQAQQRAAYVSALRHYVWGTTPTSGNGSNAGTVSTQSNKPKQTR